jgi:hypothetical protein
MKHQNLLSIWGKAVIRNHKYNTVTELQFYLPFLYLLSMYRKDKMFTLKSKINCIDYRTVNAFEISLYERNIIP